MEKRTDCLVMFVDIAGSTRLYHEFGDTLAQDSIARSLIHMSENIKRNKGTVIKFIGDEILCYFEQVGHAITAAFSLNELLEQLKDPNDIKIKIRIGLHFGATIIDQHGIYGDTVNVAAAMREMAGSRQIIATGSVVEKLPAEIAHCARRIDASRLKGRTEETVIYQLQWEDEDHTQVLSAIESSQRQKTTQLQLVYRNQEICLRKNMPVFILGRDADCSMIVEGELISRHHATIEYRKGKFIFIDSSTNGTYISTEEGRNVYVCHEEVPLWGCGNISLGHIPEQDASNLIQYISH